MNACVRERGRTGGDNNSLTCWCRVIITNFRCHHGNKPRWWNGEVFRCTIWSCVCVCVCVRLFCCSDQLRFNKAYHTHWALAVFVVSLHSCPIAPKYHISKFTFTFTFMHLADAFIQSDLQLHSGYTFLNTKWLCFSSGTGKVSLRLSHLSLCLIDWVCMTMCVLSVMYDVISEISPHAQRPEATERQHVPAPPPQSPSFCMKEW